MWRRSSFCTGAACVEVAFVEGVVTVRDAKDPYGAVLLFSPAEFGVFLAGVKAGKFDLAALARSAGDGSGPNGAVRVSGAAVAGEEAA